MSTRKELILVLPLLILLVVLPLWQIVTGQGVFITNDVGVSDIANLQYPLRHFAGTQLRQGRLPLWTPGVYMGYPLLAEGQAGVFSPVNLLLFGLLPVSVALNVGSLLPFVLAAAGAYLLARELGASIAGGFLAGFAYALSGFYVAHVKHIPIVTTAAWIPVLLWLVERGVRRSDAALLGAGLVMGIQWLSGSPQMAFYSAGFATLYFAVRAWQLRAGRPLRRTIPIYALALALSLGLGAVQLLPTYQLVGTSERAGRISYEFATRFSYALANLKTFLYPLVNGTPGTGDLTVSSIFWEDYAYIGLIPLLLGVVGGLVLARRSGLARLLVGLAVISLLLVLGPHTPFFEVAYRVVPGLSFFRFPQRFLAFLTLFLVLLAALALTGLQRWVTEKTDKGRRTKDGRRKTATQANRPRLTRLDARERIITIITVTILLLVVVDLYIYHVPWNAVVDADTWLEPPETAQVMQERAGSELYRVFSYDVYDTFRAAYRQAGGWRGDLEPYVAQREFLQPSLNLLYDVQATDGYVNLVPECLTTLWGTEKQLGLMDRGLVEAGDQLLAKPGFVKSLGLYNGRYLITSLPVEDEALDLIGVYGPDAHLYENREMMPRVFAVPDHVVAEDMSAALDLAWSPSFDPETTVILIEQPTAPPGAADEVGGSDLAATVNINTYEPNRIVIEADLSGPGWLVVSDTYFPGWEAALDGQPAPIYQANGCVRAVPIESGGSHEVVFEFRPRPFYQGALISAASGILLVSGLVLLTVRQRSSAAKE